MLLVVLLLSVGGVTLADQGCHRRVCYYTSWSQDRQGDGRFTIDDIDPNLCTHIIYSFASLVNSTLVSTDVRDESSPSSKGMYERFTNLKIRNPDLKTMIAVGGYAMGVDGFSKAVETATSRKAFISQAIKFLRFYNFDGLDIDWEYPAHRGSPAADKKRLTLLVQELRAAMDVEASASGLPRLLLSAALSAAVDIADTAYDAVELSKSLDFVNLMTYDFHGSWQSQTGHNSPLYAHSSETGTMASYNIHSAVQYFLAKGVPASSINLGLATYGRTFTLEDTKNNTINAPVSGPGTPGNIVGAKGIVSFYEVCKMLANGSTPSYIKEQSVPYIVNGDQWIGYDDVQSIKQKIEYAANQGLGGVMFWELSLDDFSGNYCGKGDFPLINAAKQICSDAFVVTNISETPSTPFNISELSPQSPSEFFSGVCKADGFYPDKSTCTHYFMCSGGKLSRIQCPTGLAYNSVRQYCDYISETLCASTSTTPFSPSGNSFLADHVLHTDEFQCDQFEDGFFPNPSECETYFICTAGKAYLLRCAEDLTFNAVTKFCDYPSNHNCKPSASPFMPTTNAVTYINSDVTHQQVTHSQKFQCNNGLDGFFPNPVDCGSYFICTDGLAYHLHCAKDLTFNAVTKFCDFPSNHACKLGSSPTLSPQTTHFIRPISSFQSTINPISVTHSVMFQCDPHNDGFFPDPDECESYFICTSGLAYHIKCAEGLTFNEVTMFCDNPFRHDCKPGSFPSIHSQSTPVFAASSTNAVASQQSSMLPIQVTHSEIFQCDPTENGFFPNPSKCESYFICTDGHAYLLNCAKDLTFNSVTKFCDIPEHHDCKLGSSPQSQTTHNLPGILATHATETHSYEYNCDPQNDGFFPNQDECESYFICTSGLAYSLKCAQGLTFNEATQFCDHPKNHACKLGSAPASIPSPSSQPPSTNLGSSDSTTSSNTVLPTATSLKGPTVAPVDELTLCMKQNMADGLHSDPTSCHHYIRCVNHVTTRVACPRGMAWDPAVRACDLTYIASCQ